MSYTPEGKTREKVLRFVRARILAGEPPTVREVRDALGFSAVETARRHLANLVTEGWLMCDKGKARGYRLPKGTGGPSLMVPLLGRVQAGALTAAIEDPEGYISVPAAEARGELFALRVRGESMTGAGILPNDIAVVRRQPTAASGDVVVAMVDDEATVKTLRLRRGRVELHAANPDFPPIIPRPADVTILGKVIEIRRFLEETVVWEEPR
jgi:repressor LexA